MQTPANIYEPSPRPFPNKVPEVDYPHTMQVLKVKSQGCFRWKKHDVFLTEVLWGEPIGLLPIDEDNFMVNFAHLPLARFDSRRLKIGPLAKTRLRPTPTQEWEEASPPSHAEEQKPS